MNTSSERATVHVLLQCSQAADVSSLGTQVGSELKMVTVNEFTKVGGICWAKNVHALHFELSFSSSLVCLRHVLRYDYDRPKLSMHTFSVSNPRQPSTALDSSFTSLGAAHQPWRWRDDRR